MVIGLCVSLPAALMMVILHCIHRPFPKAERWKHFVKVHIYCLVSFTLVSNFVVFLLHSDSAFDSPEKSRTKSIILFILSILCFVFGIGLFLTLILAFLLTIIRDSLQLSNRKSSHKNGRGTVFFRAHTSSALASSSPGSSDSWLRRKLDHFMSLFFNNAPAVSTPQTEQQRISVIRNDLSNYLQSKGNLTMPGQFRQNTRSLQAFSGETRDARRFDQEHQRNLAPIRVRSGRAS